MKRYVILASLVLCSSCDEQPPDALVVNLRDTGVTLIYLSSSQRPASYGMPCQDTWGSPLVPVEELSRYRKNALKPAQTTHDPPACEVRVSLPARTATLIGASVCSDEWQLVQATPGARPEFDYLRIESATGMIAWRGWEVSRAFVSHKSYFGTDSCRLDIT